jgi:uncharacterized membrane protein
MSRVSALAASRPAGTLEHKRLGRAGASASHRAAPRRGRGSRANTGIVRPTASAFRPRRGRDPSRGDPIATTAADTRSALTAVFRDEAGRISAWRMRTFSPGEWSLTRLATEAC